MGILTVGVVTEPFKFEGKRIMNAAKSGIEEMSKYVDSLIIVNNQNLMKYYNSLPINEAYAQVDDILKNAVKCIAEIVTVTYGQNVDFNDVKSIMEHSGKALLGIATANGEDRVRTVLEDVLNCPLLENSDISDAKNFLFFVTYGPDKQITMGELEMLEDRFDEMQSDNVHVIWGHGLDETLGDSIKLSLVVTNFDSSHKEESEIIIDTTGKTIVDSIEEAPVTTIPEISTEQAPQAQEEPATAPVMESQEFTMPEASTPEFTDPLFRNVETPEPTYPSFNYNDDDIFNKMVNEPSINRNNEVMTSAQVKAPVTLEEEPNNAVYYELKDDVFDVFHGLAD
jgi:cell division protein FtsZ